MLSKGYLGASVLSTSALLFALFVFAPTAQAGASVGVWKAPLRGTQNDPGARGTAIFFDSERGPDEVSLSVLGLPRDQHAFYVAWVVNDAGRARIVGGFPRTRPHGFKGALIAPGPRNATENSLRACVLLVITRVSSPRAKQLLLKARRADFLRPREIVGEPVLEGQPKPLADLV